MPFMTPDEVEYLALCEHAAERYGPRVQEWYGLIGPGGTHRERIERGQRAHEEMHERLRPQPLGPFLEDPNIVRRYGR